MIISNQKFEKEIIEKQILSAEHDLGLPLGSKERMYLEERAKLLSEKMQQVARALPDELVGLDCVQAFVSNMSTATSLEELSLTDGTTLPEELLSAPTIEWTSPKWAKAGDIVVLAGKGHETYQEIRGVKRPFDEKVVVRDLLAELQAEKTHA